MVNTVCLINEFQPKTEKLNGFYLVCFYSGITSKDYSKGGIKRYSDYLRYFNHLAKVLNFTKAAEDFIRSAADPFWLRLGAWNVRN